MMLEKFKKGWRWMVATPMFSPVGFVVCATLIILVYGIVQLIGWREYTSIFSGTSPSGNPADIPEVLIGVLYSGAYLAYALLAPILLIAAAIFYALERWLAPRPATDETPAQVAANN